MEYRYILAGRSLKLDEARCVGCGLCREVCPHAVFELAAAADGGKARVVGRSRCMECGACARNCPAGAIAVTAGVGCAAAVIGGLLRGGEPSCGCDAACDGGPRCC
jgi:NAD-dependent dihydropyrimidine dehydrogenase PreA subunit